MEDYLPPIVTRLKGDWSDLRAAFLESRAAAKAWAAGIKDDIVSGLRNAGHLGGLAFADALKATAAKELLEGFDEDIGRKLAEQGRKAGQKAGQSTASSLLATFKGMFIPGLIALLVMFTPMIGAAIASAITLGLGLGFVGIAALVQKSNPLLVKAATGFKDTVVAAFKEATSPMVAPMIEALGIIAAGVKAMAPAFKEIFAAIGPAVPNLAHGLVEMIQAMLPGLKELAPVMGTLISTLGVVLPDIGAGLGGMFKELAAAAPSMIIFLEDFGSVMGDVLPMIGAVLAGLANIYAFVEQGRGQGFGLFGGVELLVAAWPKVVAGAKDAWEWIKKVAAAVGTWVSDKAGALAGWWDGVVEAVRTKGKQVTDWFEGLPDRVDAWLAAWPGKVRDTVTAGFDHIFFTLGFMGGKLIEWADRISTFFETLPTRIGMIVGQLWVSVKQKFDQGVTDTTHAVGNWAQRIPGILDKLMADFAAWGRRTWETVTNWVHTTVTDVLKWWDSLPGKISATNDKLIATIKAWASGAINWLFNAGKNMIQGLVDGAIAATAGAIGAIQRAIQRIIDGAKRALGIASPSRVFAEMGRFSMLGFVQGLQGEQGQLARAWAGLAPTSPVIRPAASPAMALAGGGGGGEPILVQLALDGAMLVEKLIVPAQERKLRTGQTGLG